MNVQTLVRTAERREEFNSIFAEKREEAPQEKEVDVKLENY